MIDISTILKHYKREDIQKEILYNAKDKEVAVKFKDKFGNRPDILKYPNDILELAKQGGSSFHASEELWRNPLQLDATMKRKELEDLRIGWDLVLDIDCPYWNYSKLITYLMIKALKKHAVSAVSCKFSGSKGFHIGVPFEAFPKKVNDKETRLLFPDGVRIIASYLIDYIDCKETDYELTKKILENKTIKDLSKEIKVPYKKLTKLVCKKCGTKLIKKDDIMEIICPYCDETNKIKESSNFFHCKKCKKLIRTTTKKDSCLKCKGNKFIEKLDTRLILNVDAVLISSRHLYRMPYSLHEKSGLCSVPINPDKVLEFEKIMAKPENIKVTKFRFLDKRNVEKNNAKNLFDDAFYWHITTVKEKDELKEMYKGAKKYEMPSSALKENFFPPCIKNILKGLEDGRKRSVFILINFLTNVGWDYDKIEKLLKEWNKKNYEALREVYIIGQLRYHKQKRKKILPPNCQNQMYYKDMLICTPDNLCQKIKNPVNYSMRKTFYLKKERR